MKRKVRGRRQEAGADLSLCQAQIKDKYCHTSVRNLTDHSEPSFTFNVR